jgi:hypothetical protein
MHESRFVNPLTRQVEVTETLETFFACRNCGRDVTDAWKEIQPAPKAEAVIGPPPDPLEPDDLEATAFRLGIAATANGASS